MCLRFKFALADVIEFNRSSSNQRIKALIIALLGVTLLVFAIWGSIVDNDVWANASSFAFAFFFLLLALFGPTLAGLGAWRKTSREVHEVDVLPQGLVAMVDGRRQELEWRAFARFYETKNLLVLLPPGAIISGHAVCIPKRSCTSEQWIEVMQIVRNGIDGKVQTVSTSEGH